MGTSLLYADIHHRGGGHSPSLYNLLWMFVSPRDEYIIRWVCWHISNALAAAGSSCMHHQRLSTPGAPCRAPSALCNAAPSRCDWLTLSALQHSRCIAAQLLSALQCHLLVCYFEYRHPNSNPHPPTSTGIVTARPVVEPTPTSTCQLLSGF